MPGTHFGPYEIVAPLGAGGMGEVYRARDPRLGREVALKVLPAAWAKDADRLRRFEIEARAAGQLNHPNILSVYDFGVQEGAPYLVVELLEGESLRERLTPPTALPARKAIEIATQVARGLAAAHAKGIVHRDLKPENIFLTRGGQAKILDFGLAKVNVPVSDDAATVAANDVTSAGTVLGTAGYMAPEQVRGEAADARSDLFASGAILYEMAAGRRAFQKATAVETMSAVLREEPSSAAIEPALQRVLDHCLEKDPAARFQSARDLEFALAAAEGTSTAARAAVPPPRRGRPALLPVALCGLAAGALIMFFLTRAPAPAPQVNMRFAIPAPQNGELNGGLAISPDGTAIVYAALNGAGVSQLWLRPMGSLDARMLAGADGANWPFWSPDGKQVGFFSATGLSTLDVNSGAVQQLAPTPVAITRGGTWGAGGMIVYQPAPTGALMKIPAQGGTPVAADTGTAAGGTDRWPQFLPDGQHFIFLRLSPREQDGTLLEASLADPTPHVIAGMPVLDSQAIYTDGALLYSLNGSVTAQPFDWRRGKVTGPPHSLAIPLTPAGLAGATGALALAASNGALAWYQSENGLNQLAVVNGDGKIVRTVGEPANYLGWSLSPDGKTIATSLVDAAGTNAIWLLDVGSGARRRLTYANGQYQTPIWSPDGQWIYYGLAPGGILNTYRKRADGAGAAEQLTSALHGAAPSGFSPDGRTLLYTSLNGTEYDLRFLQLQPHGPDQLLQAFASYGQVSPDGDWIAYATHAQNPTAAEVFVMPNPPTGSRWQISPTHGSQPVWSRDGTQLYYRSGLELMAARVLPPRAGAFTFSAPQRVLTLPVFQGVISGAYTAQYAPMPDGKEFLAAERVAATGSAGITILTDWPRLLH